MVAFSLPGIFVMGCLVYLRESYVIRCPEQAEWNIRAEIRCQNTTTYFCLYNYIAYSYEEGCTGPDWDRPGSKRVYSRNFNRAPCNDTRYQPIIFVTNGNSDCIFRKSLCTDEGQILFSNGTTRTDSTCRCDYTQGYAFVTVPRSKCYCQPSEEDCSCYLKKCPGIGYYLSADYECTKNGTKKTVRSLMSENPSEDPHIDMAPTGTPREYDSYAIRRKFEVVIVILVCTFGMIVITMCFMFHQRLPKCPQQSTKQARTAETERMDTGPLWNTIESVNTVITICMMLQQRLPRYPCVSTEQNGNRLEEIVSGNNEDNQIGLRELIENWKSADKELKQVNIKHIKEGLENWRNEPVKLAVTGKYGVGKSSFINAIRNLKSGDPGFATVSCSGYTTKRATVYEYPGNPKITLHDLPGFGTTKGPTNEYEKTMELYRYDYFLIFVGNIEENDIEMAKKLKEMKKPFCFVRSKLDFDIENAKNDGEPEAEAIQKIMSKSLHILLQEGFREAKFFVISNHSRRIGHFNELVLYIQSNLPNLKCDAIIFSLLGELSDHIIDSKYIHLKKRTVKVSDASVCLARDPVSDIDRVLNITLICQELLLYHNTFGFEQQSVKDILKDDYIRQKLNTNSIIEIQADEEAMRKFVKSELKKLRTSQARENPNDTFILLNQILNDCRDDAKLVYSHKSYEKAQRLRQQMAT